MELESAANTPTYTGGLGFYRYKALSIAHYNNKAQKLAHIDINITG